MTTSNNPYESPAVDETVVDIKLVDLRAPNRNIFNAAIVCGLSSGAFLVLTAVGVCEYLRRIYQPNSPFGLLLIVTASALFAIPLGFVTSKLYSMIYRSPTLLVACSLVAVVAFSVSYLVGFRGGVAGLLNLVAAIAISSSFLSIWLCIAGTYVFIVFRTGRNLFLSKTRTTRKPSNGSREI